MVGQVLNFRSANDRLNRHVDRLGIQHESRGRAIAGVVDDSDKEWLVGDTTIALPDSEADGSTTEALLGTRFVSVGSEGPLSALVAFEDNALRIVDVRIHSEVHDFFIDREVFAFVLKSVDDGGDAKGLVLQTRGGRVDLGLEATEVLLRDEAEDSILSAHLHSHHDRQVVIVYSEVGHVFIG